MEKERRTKALVIVVMLIVVAGLTVAFASLSSVLNIKGTAYLDAAKWGIKFQNLSEPVKTGTANTSGTAKIEEAKSAEISNINVNLSTPGDKVVYTVDLVNEGTINAKIDKIEKTELTSEQQKYLTFKVTDKSGNEISEDDILSAGERRNLTITIEFIKDLTKEDLPTKASTISLSYKLNFVQTDEKATTSKNSNVDKTYAVGDEFCLGEECFYTIKDNGTTVDALAKQNVNTETNRQDENANTIAFAVPDESKKKINCSASVGCYYGYWTDDTSNHNLLSKYGTKYPSNVFDSNSNLYEPVQNYKTYLKNTLGKTSVDARLITYEELIGLGCTKNKYTCKSAPLWVYSVGYWTSSAYDSYRVWCVHSDGDFNHGLGFDHTTAPGLRPVITISKTEL